MNGMGGGPEKLNGGTKAHDPRRLEAGSRKGGKLYAGGYRSRSQRPEAVTDAERKWIEARSFDGTLRHGPLAELAERPSDANSNASSQNTPCTTPGATPQSTPQSTPARAMPTTARICSQLRRPSLF